MRTVKDKKKDYQKETIFFMWVWILLFGLGLVLKLTDASFGEEINIGFILISCLYLVFFGFGLYFAKQGKKMAGFFELTAGGLIILNDFLLNKGIGFNGILGILIVAHAIMYLHHHRK